MYGNQVVDLVSSDEEGKPARVNESSSDVSDDEGFGDRESTDDIEIDGDEAVSYSNTDIDPSMFVEASYAYEDETDSPDLTAAQHFNEQESYEDEVNGHTQSEEEGADFGNFTGAMHFNDQDIYTGNFTGAEKINLQGVHQDNYTELARYGNEADYSNEFTEVQKFNEQEPYPGDSNESYSGDSHMNIRYSIEGGYIEGGYIDDLTATQQFKQENNDNAHAYRTEVPDRKREKMYTDKLIESDEDVQVRYDEGLNVFDLMQVQNSPMVGIHPSTLTRPPMGRAQVEVEQSSMSKPKNEYKIADASHSKVVPQSKIDSTVQHPTISSSQAQITQVPEVGTQFKSKVTTSSQVQVNQASQGPHRIGQSTKAGPETEPTVANSNKVTQSNAGGNDNPPVALGAECVETHVEFKIPLDDLLEVQQLRNLIISHVRAIYVPMPPHFQRFDVIITRCLKSGDWVAHAIAYYKSGTEWMVLMGFRDQEGHLRALRGLQSMTMEKLSAKTNQGGVHRLGQKIKGLPM